MTALLSVCVLTACSNGEYENAMVEISNLNQIKSEQEIQNASLSEENEKLNNEISNLNKSQTSLQSEVSSLKKDKTSLTSQVSELKKENSELNQKIKTAQTSKPAETSKEYENSQSSADLSQDITDENSLINQISNQDVRVISTDYTVQDERYKSLYPDLLKAIIVNNTSYDIRDAVVAFVAWDNNNLPVKIKGRYDMTGSYIKRVNYSDINLVPGSTYGENEGLGLDDDCDNISTFKAIIVSYETFDGIKWSNPLYSSWCKLYEGVKLK